jgi:hypothetical protein
VAKRGRPDGSIIRLLDDPGRFELAAWLAFTEGLGMKPYPAANLVTLLVTSDAKITTESVEGVLLKSSMTYRGPIKGHADRVRRKAPDAIARADERELGWLTNSSGLIVALVKFTVENNVIGISTTLGLLRNAGWAETLDRIGKRLSETLLSNFPPAEGPLSPAARRLLLKMQRRPQ